MKNLLGYFKKNGGFKYIKNLFFEGLLFYAFLVFLFIPKNRAGLKQFEEILSNKRLLSYRRKFRKIFQDYDHFAANKNLQPEIRKVIWFLWLQGLDAAPPVVKKCHKALVDKLHDYEIILLTADNIDDYVSLPNFIFEKWQNGRITNTHFSDILRNNLLLNHGGYWSDATVLFSEKIPALIENSSFFLFQSYKPGSNGKKVNISSWFIGSVKNNPVLEVTQEMLFNYWKNCNDLIDYFLYHNFLQMALYHYSEIYKLIPKYTNETAHYLLFELKNHYDDLKYKDICKQVFAHKLTYKLPVDFDKNTDGTFYKHIVEQNRR